MDIQLWSATNDKGVKQYGVNVDATPVMPGNADKEVAIRMVARQAADARNRNIRPTFSRWDGDLGELTNLYPDLTNVSR